MHAAVIFLQQNISVLRNLYLQFTAHAENKRGNERSKKIGNDQEQIQSDHISRPKNQKGNKRKLTKIQTKLFSNTILYLFLSSIAKSSDRMLAVNVWFAFDRNINNLAVFSV